VTALSFISRDLPTHHRLLVGLFAALCFTACGGASYTAPLAGTLPATSQDALTGFARDDQQMELAREDLLKAAMSTDSARASMDATPLPRQLLAAFEEAGLDAGLWTFQASPPEYSGGVHVMGRLEGSDAPDQIILLAAGGADQAGVAGLLEVARGLGALAQTGWQPRRTMMLAIWDSALPGRASARAWLEKGPMEAAHTTMAMLAVDHGLAGDTFRIAATPDLRILARRLLPADATIDSPDGRRAAGAFLAAGVSTLEISRAPGRRRSQAHPSDVVAAARLWGTLALRLAEAALPPHNMAVTAQRTLTELRQVEDAAGVAFAGNPPPTKDLRVAILRLRQAAEAWNNAAGAAVASLSAIPRGPDPDGQRAALEDAGRLALAAGRIVLTRSHGDDSCRNLLYCPAAEDAGPAVFLPGLARTMAREDRAGYVTESLTLATAIGHAARRLTEATGLLRPPAEETP